MNGCDELAQLAHLLRVGARTAKQIAADKFPDEYRDVARLAAQAYRIASALERIAKARNMQAGPIGRLQ